MSGTTRDDAERAREIAEMHRSGILPATAELLIDAEDDPYLRADCSWIRSVRGNAHCMTPGSGVPF